jgi:hypothetical protein
MLAISLPVISITFSLLTFNMTLDFLSNRHCVKRFRDDAIFLTLVSSSVPATSNPMCVLLIIMVIIIIISGIIVFGTIRISNTNVKNMAYDNNIVTENPTRSPDSTGNKKTRGFKTAKSSVGMTTITV